MRKHKSSTPQFAICVDNAGYLASLTLRKIYRVLPDKSAEPHNYIRVIDNEGEDYLYPAERFLPVDLPPDTKKALIRISREAE